MATEHCINTRRSKLCSHDPLGRILYCRAFSAPMDADNQHVA
jgi:hypothetical protein